MSIRMVRTRTAVRSQALARNAAQDGVVGVVLGLLLAPGLIASNLELRELVADSHAPLASLGVLVAVVVAQCALAAGVCGLAFRKLAARD